MPSMSFDMKDISENVSETLKNPYVKGTLLMIIVLYASFAAPRLPHTLAPLFDNPWVRILVLSAIAYIATKDYSIAIVVAFVFVLVISSLKCESLQSQIADYAYGIPFAGRVLPSRKGMMRDIGQATGMIQQPYNALFGSGASAQDSMAPPVQMPMQHPMDMDNEGVPAMGSLPMSADVSTYPLDGNKIAIETAGDEGYYVNPPSYGGCGLYDDLTKRASIGSGAVGGYDSADKMYQFS